MKKTMIMILLLATFTMLMIGCSSESPVKSTTGKKVIDHNNPDSAVVSPGPEPRTVVTDKGEVQTYKDVEPRKQQECEVDSDCVPIPTCHPRTCINKQYTSFYQKPDACTEMFDCSAAYDASDCKCIGTKCTNMNLGDKGCPDLPR